MITVGVAVLFVLVLLAACVAAALSSPALQQIGELPEDFLPLDYRQSQLMDRSVDTGQWTGHWTVER